MEGETSRRMFWRGTRTAALLPCFAALLPAAQQEDQTLPGERRQPKPDPNEDPRLPDGKSQKNAMAKEQHEHALKDANDLVGQAEQLRDEIERAGNYTVSMASVKRTEDIEKLVKRIRGRLRY